MAESQRSDWTVTNIWYLSLMTLGYIFGEIAHFLINTTSKEVARGKSNFQSVVYPIYYLTFLFDRSFLWI